jgi:hypothetical protein
MRGWVDVVSFDCVGGLRVGECVGWISMCTMLDPAEQISKYSNIR